MINENDPVDASSHLEYWVIELRRRLDDGESWVARSMLQRNPQLLADQEVAIELIYREYVHCEQQGRQVDDSAWLQNHPDCSERLERLLILHRTFEDEPVPIELSRFSSGCHPSGRTGEPEEGIDVQLPRIGQYQPIHRIGTGAAGVVYKSRQQNLDRYVALKVMRNDSLNLDLTQRFYREAEAAANLSHPNITQVHEVGSDAGYTFISMELVDGGSLGQFLRERQPSINDSAQLVACLAEAIHYAHSRGVIHRDLKPDNILLADSNLSQPKIADFGLAKQLLQENSQLTIHGMVIGTPSYMAPEQAAGTDRDISTSVDIYSLGAILYECIAGRPPFQGATILETLDQVRNREPVSPAHIDRNVSRDLEAIVLKCLEKSPACRYPTAKALSDDLQNFLSGNTVNARPVTALVKTRNWLRRRPLVAALSALFLLSLVFGVAGIGWQWHQAKKQAERADIKRAEADKNFAEAWQAISRLAAINENLLFVSGAEEIRRKAMTEVVTFYQQHLDSFADDPKALIRAANSNFQLANIMCSVGETEEALPLLLNALEIRKGLKSRFPDSVDHIRSVANEAWRIGVLFTEQQEFEKSARNFLIAADAYKEAMDVESTTADQSFYSNSLNNAAEAFRKCGNLAKAIEMNDQAIDWAKDINEQFAKLNYSLCLEERMEQLLVKGQIQSAAELGLVVLEIQEDYFFRSGRFNKYSEPGEWARRDALDYLGRVKLRCAEILFRVDPADENAQVLLESALWDFERRSMEFPGRPAMTFRLAMAHELAGNIFSLQGSRDLAMTHYRTSIEIQSRLVRDFVDYYPARIQLARLLAYCPFEEIADLNRAAELASLDIAISRYKKKLESIRRFARMMEGEVLQLRTRGDEASVVDKIDLLDQLTEVVAVLDRDNRSRAVRKFAEIETQTNAQLWIESQDRVLMQRVKRLIDE